MHVAYNNFFCDKWKEILHCTHGAKENVGDPFSEFSSHIHESEFEHCIATFNIKTIYLKDCEKS